MHASCLPERFNPAKWEHNIVSKCQELIAQWCDVMCPRRIESPEWLYFEIFKFSLWCCWRFKFHGIYVVLLGKYFPVLWRIIVCSSSGSSNPKRIFIPICSGLAIYLGLHELQGESFQLILHNPHKTWKWL